MSRFADTGATRTVDLGPCECPGTPHESDWAKVRAQLSLVEIGNFSGAEKPENIADALAQFVVEWNLLGPDGTAWAPNADNILALMAPTLNAIVTAVGESITESSSVPNGSGAPSRASSRRSASRPPTKTRTPTT